MSAKSKFVKNRDRFYRDLSDAFEASESLFKFLDRRRQFCEDQGQEGIANIYDGMIVRMDESSELAHVIGPIVPAIDVLSLSTVDEAPDDEERARILRGLAYSIKRRNEMRKVLWKAISGPLIAAVVTIGLPLQVAFQLPTWDELVPHTQWGTLGEAFYWLCYAIRHYYVLIGAALVGGLYLFIKSFANWSGDTRSKLDAYLPYSIYRDIAASGFLTALAELMATKKPLIASLETLKERATPWMDARIQKTLDYLDDKPGEYAEAFNTSMLSPDLHLSLVTYAERGNARTIDANDAFSEGLVQLGTDGLDQVVESVERNSVWLSLASTVVVVMVILLFYGGNMYITGVVTDRMQDDANATQQAR